jgi:hypothetical protein
VSTLVLANFPIAFLIFAAIVGIPLWMTFKRPDKAPEYGQAAIRVEAMPASAGRTTGRLSTARQHAAARTPVPGRLHAAASRPVRSHTAQEQRDRIPA